MSVVQLQHLLYHRVGSFIETCDLPQVVRYFTLRAPNDGTSLTDPVLTSSPSHILECNSFPPLANYDHNGLNISISMKSTSHQSQCGGTPMLTLLNYPTEDWPKPTYYHLDSKLLADKKLY